METRRVILEQALRLFATRGYEAVGVQEVCEAAGVTKPTLYHHFGNKGGLFEALLQERCLPFLDTLGRAAEYTGDLPRTLHQVTLACFQFARSEPMLSRLLLGLWFAPVEGEAHQRAAGFLEKQHQLVRELFRRAAEDHGNMKGRHQIHAATLLGTLQTYISLSFTGAVDLNEQVARQAMQHFAHGIYS